MILSVGKMKRFLVRGFTLVELLIVIGLLGAIAVIVIAAINPIEQANRARDARFKADSSQLISAVERYFATHSKFPWEVCAGGNCTTSADDPFGFVTAGDYAVGLCGDGTCATLGELITSDELKNEFLSRDWVKATTTAGKIMIGKATGSSSSVYACFIPLAKSSRTVAINDSKVRALSFDATGIPTVNANCTTAAEDWSAVNKLCYICIPE